jgi:nicotinate dehydrogenase subunit B
LLGVNQPLALNGNLHSERPDNLVRVIVQGIQQPPSKEVGFMPAFKHSLSDAQLSALVTWMRRRYAPERAPWSPQAIDAAIQAAR